LLGDPTNVPTIKATAGFQGNGLIDGDKYYGDNNPNNPNWISTNVFYRQVRNFVLDLTSIPASNGVNGIHWPTAQATSLQNMVFQMSAASGTQHVGLSIENGMAWLKLFSPYVSLLTVIYRLWRVSHRFDVQRRKRWRLCGKPAIYDAQLGI
jgi:hypothetical protein